MYNRLRIACVLLARGEHAMLSADIYISYVTLASARTRHQICNYACCGFVDRDTHDFSLTAACNSRLPES
jgi:hypothetical protein